MINPNEVELITLSDACKTLPKRRRGKRPAVSTLYRWASHGLNGVRLETLQCAGTKVTSREALARFFVSLTERGTAPREAERAAAEQELDRDGWDAPARSAATLNHRE